MNEREIFAAPQQAGLTIIKRQSREGDSAKSPR
jgi:hypothetical protein